MIKNKIPHTITLLNLFCGCCALIAAIHQQYLMVFGFLFLSGLADYSDGLVARWLDVRSEMGKELDSLADMVSFGVVPGMILYRLLSIGLNIEVIDQALVPMATPAFLVSVFACYRLAKFNLDTRQTESFIGLNTPSSTMFVTGLMLIYHFDSFGLGEWVTNPIFLVVVIVVLSFLQVSELPMFSFKFKHMRWRGNEIRFTFLILVVVLLVVLQEAAFSMIILMYIAFSVFANVKGKGQRAELN